MAAGKGEFQPVKTKALWKVEYWWSLFERNYCVEVKGVGRSQLFLESNPKEAKKYVYHGNIKYLKKDYEGALKCYRKALEKDYFDGGIHYNLGLIMERLQDYEEALKNYLTSLKLSCKSESYYIKSRRKVRTLKLHLKNYGR